MRKVYVALCLATAISGQQVLLPGQNSISALIAEQAPELEPGYGSADDQWMLYDWRFDLLSEAARQFLLNKYGYGTGAGGSLDSLSRTNVGRTSPKRTTGAAPRAALGPLVPGTNVDVSAAMTQSGRRLESETTLAINGQHLLVGFNSDPYSRAVAFSSDAGTNWSVGQLPSFPGVVADSGDPVLAAGPKGRFYESYLAGNAVGLLAVAVTYSDDGGATWSAPVNASASLGGVSSSLDKDWMTVDNIAGSPYQGNIYVACTRFVSSGQDSIDFMRSTDGGRTWSQATPLTTISAAEANAHQSVQGAFIAVGPSGEIYVSWYDSRAAGLRIVKSTDGGATFSNPVTALAPNGFASSYYVPGTFDVAAFGQVAVDTSSGPNRGAVYVAGNFLGNTGGAPNLDILLAHSGDGGATWDPPVRVNNDNTASDQFQPALAVAADGSLGVAFYDRRNDPAFDVLTDVYLAISRDGGKTFPTQQRVTTESWLTLPTPIGFRTGYHGDYNQMVASGNNFYLTWGDDRNGTDPDVYIAMVPATGGIADFTVGFGGRLGAALPSVDFLPGVAATIPLTSSATGVKFSAAVFPPAGVTVQASENALTAATTLDTPPGTYTITVTGDSGGVQRSAELRVTVHSNAQRLPPVALTPTASPGYNSQSAFDAQGNFHLVYSALVVSRAPKQVAYMRISADGTRHAPVILDQADVTSPDEFRFEPRVALSASGRIYVVWRRSNAATDAIVLSVSSDNGQTFSPPVDVSSHPETISGLSTQVHAFMPTVAVGQSGAVFVSYLRENVAILSGTLVLVREDVAVASSGDGGAAFPTVAAVIHYPSSSSSAAYSLNIASPPAMALDSHDRPYVAWAANNSLQGPDIFVARSLDGGATFQTAANASGFRNPNITPRQPALAIDANNVVYVAWNNLDHVAGSGDNLLAVSTDGVNFNVAANLSQASYYSGAVTDWPAIRVDPSGDVIAVWREWVDASYRDNDTERDIFYTRCWSHGFNCAPPLNISTSLGDTLLSAGGGQIQPAGLAVDTCGRAHVTYDDDTAGATQVMLWVQPEATVRPAKSQTPQPSACSALAPVR